MGALKLLLIGACLAWTTPAAADPVMRWSSDIAGASLRFGIPEDWIRRVMRIESGGETMLGGQPIVSRAGAMGLMQLMPGTWRDMRALLGLGPDPHNPRDNILAGAAYLRSMFDRFGYPGLFAAYNAGPARYATYLATGRRLPAETRSYVATVAESGGLPLRNDAPARMTLFAVGPQTPVRGTAGPATVATGSTLFVPLGSGGQP